ncbi:alpha/beta hydrolase [Streptomyces caniscabiei]|uniref:alpha/beta hydrolase n=1 Tax=Streptomyces caniscabiei TaxID=2746961 RepID=UPI0029BB0CEF|nr:alpha/beta hydrolase [Streptomyces caniscabiei]MDX2776635.1 alpha/beta hydrolase [Streptomyces caniscabiei]
MVKSAGPKKQKDQKPHKPWWKKLLFFLAWFVGVIITLGVIIWIAFQVSPWPSALLLRSAFEQNAQEQVAIMNKYVPASGIDANYNISYRNNDKDAKMDVFTTADAAKADKALPTVIWVHGGGWISGSKESVAPYLKIMASRGYTTIGLDYSIAPEKQYPTPIIQVTEALKYINEHAAELNVDKNQIVLAGDSAGSQIAAQVATIITNPQYAKLMNMTPPIQASQLSAMLLSCGAYDLSLANANDGSEGAQLIETFLWAYSGYKDFSKDTAIYPASVVEHVNKDFPPSFITAGNKDPLLQQSEVMAAKLKSLGVTTDTLFYPPNYTPELQHEYQFNLDISAGQNALNDILSFLKQHTH